MVDSLLNHFSECCVHDLEAFVLVRNTDILKTKLPKKGNLEDAVNGEDNLIKVAFESRGLVNALQKQMKDTENNNTEIFGIRVEFELKGSVLLVMSLHRIIDFDNDRDESEKRWMKWYIS